MKTHDPDWKMSLLRGGMTQKIDIESWAVMFLPETDFSTAHVPLGF
jgi:hypothetical protein